MKNRSNAMKSLLGVSLAASLLLMAPWGGPKVALGQTNVRTNGAMMNDQLLPLNSPPRQVHAWCEDEDTGNPVKPCLLSVQVVSITNSNSHYNDFHSGTRPTSTVDPPNNQPPFSGYLNGEIFFDHTTKHIGQQETLVVFGGDGGVCITYWVGAGRPDVTMFYNDHPERWEKIGATPEHGTVNENRYMTWNAANQFYNASEDYLSVHGTGPNFPNGHNHQTTGKLAVNDMSLPFGGKFDLEGKWGYDSQGNVTNEKHLEHQVGTAVDIRANTLTHAIPLDHQPIFEQLCRNRGATLAQTEFPVGDSRRHIHCRWGF